MHNLGKLFSVSVPHSLISKVAIIELRAEAVVRFKVPRKGPRSHAQRMLVINRHLVNIKEFLTVAFCKSMGYLCLFIFLVLLYVFIHLLYLLEKWKSERQISRATCLQENGRKYISLRM